MRACADALAVFLAEAQDGKIKYRDGRLYRYWEPRRNWIDPKPAEHLATNGYLVIRGMRSGKMIYCMAHRLVWAIHHGPIPEGLEINHKNGIKRDNRIGNLELATRSENGIHAFRTGLNQGSYGAGAGRAKLSARDVEQIKCLLAAGRKQADIAKEFGVRPNQISRIKTGARRAHDKGDSGMNAKYYQSAVSRTMNHALDHKEATSNYSMGLAGEVGEVIEPLKKWAWHGHSLDIGDLRKELGDVMFYVAALCNTWGIDMSEAMEFNIERLARRYPQGFDQKASQERKE